MKQFVYEKQSRPKIALNNLMLSSDDKILKDDVKLARYQLSGGAKIKFKEIPWSHVLVEDGPYYFRCERVWMGAVKRPNPDAILVVGKLPEPESDSDQ